MGTDAGLTVVYVDAEVTNGSGAYGKSGEESARLFPQSATTAQQPRLRDIGAVKVIVREDPTAAGMEPWFSEQVRRSRQSAHDARAIIEGDVAEFHSGSGARFASFLMPFNFRMDRNVIYLAGHNIIDFDMHYIGGLTAKANVGGVIDTLALSALLFPGKTSHALGKGEKLSDEELNNPLVDARKCRALFLEEMQEWRRLSPNRRRIYERLLSDSGMFEGFFAFLHDAFPDDSKMGEGETSDDATALIRREIGSLPDPPVCPHAPLADLATDHPAELALALSYAFAPRAARHLSEWAIDQWPDLPNVVDSLCRTPCGDADCPYCPANLDATAQLRKWFGFDSFRTWNGEELQRDAVQAAIAGESLIAVFPTGGGKSLTFQLPALIDGENADGLTLVISPLQSLMKDQVDGLAKRGITQAATINGQLNPVDRAKNMEAVESGLASLLYVAPESLRSKSLQTLISKRNLVRVVVDEAHCFSTWGQDFRVDYLYIGEFIRQMSERRHRRIPVSCFTATAKQKVVSDIRDYFLEETKETLTVYATRAERENLRYHVLSIEAKDRRDEEQAKYRQLRDLIEAKPCPTIVFVTRVKRAEDLAARLTADGFRARAYHGQMASDVKAANQEAFMAGDVDVICATSAFGMGVDKSDVGLVIHYDISASLEDYVQEAGRAGRDESITADCYVLYSERDLDGHFSLLNRDRVTISQIQQVWRAVKRITGRRGRMEFSASALELAREAGWEEADAGVENRVKTALMALERSGYLKRGLNNPRVYATSVNAVTVGEAREKLRDTGTLDEKDIDDCAAILSRLLSRKNRARGADEAGESRTDYLADELGLERRQVIHCINEMRSCGILRDDQDMCAQIRRTDAMGTTRRHNGHRARTALEEFLAGYAEEHPALLYKQANEAALSKGLASSVPAIKAIVGNWIRTGLISKPRHASSEGIAIVFPREGHRGFRTRVDALIALSDRIRDHLLGKARRQAEADEASGKRTGEHIPVNFSLVELQHIPSALPLDGACGREGAAPSLADVRNAILRLEAVDGLDIDGGFLVLYNSMRITRMETNNKRQYRKGDYEKLETFYRNKTEQIHVVGRFASMMTRDYEAALQFVRDYFSLDYEKFISTYFDTPAERRELERGVTASRYEQIFGSLDDDQMAIINDDGHQVIVVAAGPGSGKTMTLVHKLASLLLLEETRPEQLLMLTFSNAAAMEFATRLHGLVDDMSWQVGIRTFHSYSFDVLGRVGSLEDADAVERKAADAIRDEHSDVEESKCVKTCLVIDEAQDMACDEYAVVRALMERNPEMRVIAVGDDDQSIMGFRGASPRFMEDLARAEGAAVRELDRNYRSARAIVNAANDVIALSPHRLKDGFAQAVKDDGGEVECVHAPRRSAKRIVERVVDDRARLGDRFGSAAVLVPTNEDAALVTCLLGQTGVPCQLVQQRNSFRADMALEFHDFLRALREDNVAVLKPEEFSERVGELQARFAGSRRLAEVVRVLETYQAGVGDVYASSLAEMLHSSDYADLVQADPSRVFVSTYHKAKGREFDNVYADVDSRSFSAVGELARNRISPEGDALDEAVQELNALYVGMTRARRRLILFDEGGVFAPLRARLESDGAVFSEDRRNLGRPDALAIPFSLRDVNLGDFTGDAFSDGSGALVSGRPLKGDFIRQRNGASVLRFTVRAADGSLPSFRVAAAMNERIARCRSRGYRPCKARIDRVVYWYDKKAGHELKVILPLLFMKREGGAGAS